MKILFVTRPIAPPWDEASKNTVFELAKHMKWHEVHLLTVKGFACDEKHIVSEGIFSKGSLVSGQSFGQKLPLFFRLVQHDDIDIYHFFFRPAPITALAAKIALKFKKKKTVQTVVSVPRAGEQLRKSLFADKVVVGSLFMQNRLREEGIEAELIPSGVNVEQLAKPYDAQSCKKSFGFGNAPVILFAGSSEPSRGIGVVADSIGAVAKCFPQAKFVFACRFFGTRSSTENLRRTKLKIEEQGFAENAVFFGGVPNMKQLIQAADVVIFPPDTMIFKSDYPLVIIEAMAMGKPVIISNVPPLNELFDKNSSMMVKKNSPSELSNAIVSLLSNKKRLFAMGKNASALAQKRFSIKYTSVRYEKLYAQLMGGEPL